MILVHGDGDTHEFTPLECEPCYAFGLAVRTYFTNETIPEDATGPVPPLPAPGGPDLQPPPPE